MDKDVEVRNKNGHYEIYVNGVFYSGCDCGELNEELDEIERSFERSMKDVVLWWRFILW